MSGPTRSRADGPTDGRPSQPRSWERPPRPDPLPVPVADNHCHLDIADGDSWLAPAEALRLSGSVGVPRIVQIGCDLAGAAWAVRTAEEYAAVVAGVALHPNEVPRLAEAGELETALLEIERLATSSPRVRAVGETGLDYYRTGPAGHAMQQESFRWHVDLAKRLDKALVIHDRDAHSDVVRILDEEGMPARTVLHCFSGDADFARQCLDRSAYLSFAGTVTFKNAEPLRDALRLAPLDRLLVETDAPYLAPMPYRGRPNASYLVPLTVRCMADVRSDDLATLCAALAENTERVYGAW